MFGAYIDLLLVCYLQLAVWWVGFLWVRLVLVGIGLLSVLIYVV